MKIRKNYPQNFCGQKIFCGQNNADSTIHYFFALIFLSSFHPHKNTCSIRSPRSGNLSA
ncbi:unnamed protein product [Meloidogyne enterolobii]|uniref:Uncharacterized protein n=1 Tax=Meloidogyne enterolobii TaxID=390850 RepID=A0ACB1B135_MELEN